MFLVTHKISRFFLYYKLSKFQNNLLLIGATPLSRPDLAKAASPLTYIDKNDPPFLIFHGEKDNIVSNKQSKLFSAWLNYYGVKNELTIVKDAPHYGTMYDVEEIKNKVIAFLKQELK